MIGHLILILVVFCPLEASSNAWIPVTEVDFYPLTVDESFSWHISADNVSLEVVRDTYDQHACDSILVGSADDGCVMAPKCRLVAKSQIRHRLFSSDTYLCSGERVSNDTSYVSGVLSSRGLGDVDEESPIVYMPRWKSRAVKAVSKRWGTVYTVTEDSWSYLRFIRYPDGKGGLLGGDCFRDISADIEESSRGEVINDRYVYHTTRGAHKALCTEEFARRNHIYFCGSDDFNAVVKIGRHEPLRCHLTFSPLVSQEGADSRKTWEVDMPLCKDGGGSGLDTRSKMLYQAYIGPYYAALTRSGAYGDPVKDGVELPLGTLASVRQVDEVRMLGTLPNNYTIGADVFYANGRRIPCRIEVVGERELPVHTIDHSVWGKAIRFLLSGLHELMINVIGPAIKELFYVIWQLFQAIVVPVLSVMISCIMDSTFWFTVLCIILIALCVIIRYMMLKLTSSGVYVILKKDSEYTYGDTTLPVNRF